MPERRADAGEPEPAAATSAPTATDPARTLAPVSSTIAEAFLARSDDLMVLLDREGTILWASPSSERLFGLPPSSLVGGSCVDLAHVDDRRRITAALAHLPSRGDDVRTEVRMTGPAGRFRWVEVVLTDLLDEPGRGIVGHLRDITERREAERAVHFQASVLDAVGESITVRDLDGIALYWNAAAADMFGCTAEEVLGRRLGDFLGPAPGHEAQLEGAHAAHLAAQPWSGEVAVVTRDGRIIHVQTNSTPVFDDDGRHLGTITASVDLTESLAQRRRAQEDHRRLADAQASAHLGSFEVDLRTGDLIGSAELWRILGRAPSGLRNFEHIHPEDLEVFRTALQEAAAGRSDVACTHRIVRPDGVVRWVVSRSSEFNRSGGTILAGTMLDITERHDAEQALLFQATHDPLTGLVNRRLFVEQLEAVLARDPQVVDEVVVLFIDLDDFKSVNDRIGHMDADDVLRRLGARIASVVPAPGMVGRLGGDEFVVSVHGLRHRGQVQELVDGLQAAIRRPLDVGEVTLVLDSSIGLAVAGIEREAESLLRSADTAMYAAKQRGRGRAEFVDEALARTNRRRSDLVSDLRVALAAGELSTCFQPEIDLATGALFGFEALARWRHAERGMVGPDEFIALAEESGLIGTLGRQMLANACTALARWNALRPDLVLTVAVNVSPSQLADPAFPEDVRRVIEANGLRRGQLSLEVTETALMDVQSASTAIRQLRALGVTIAIDDFGTGYSSFGRLKVLPVDFLKIDQSFVADIGRTVGDDVIIATMTTLARSLGVQIIAEGIETEAQHHFLRELGCEFGQGYLWNRPLSEADANALVEQEPPVLGRDPAP